MGTSLLTSVLAFLVSLAILVAIHEFGHFWVARRMGVKVLRFSIGFGKPLLTWRGRSADQTEYVVAAIPLGGYVKMLDEREGEVEPHELHRAFNRQSVGKRAAIVAAGPIFNFLLAIVAYWIIFVIGMVGLKPYIGNVAPDSPAARSGLQSGDLIVSVSGKPTPTWDTAILTLLDKGLDHERVALVLQDPQRSTRRVTLDLSSISGDLDRGNLLDAIGMQPSRPSIPAIIGQTEPGGPADRAGLQADDLILAANGEPVADWDAWVQFVRERPGKALQLEVMRGDAKVAVELHVGARSGKQGDLGYVGAMVKIPEEISSELSAVQRYSPGEAIAQAIRKTWDMSLLTVRMLAKMVVGEVSFSNLSGPISIAQFAGYSATAGVVSFFTFLAVISISLGVLNLMPIPLLDGGHLLYYAIEAIKGSPVSDHAQMIGQRVGMAALLLLMVVAFYNDIARLLG